MAKTRIVLIAAEKQQIEIYREQLQSFDLDITTVSTIIELEKLLAKNAYNGIVLDLKTKLKAPRDQKELAYELLEHYPVLQTRILDESGKIQAMPFGKSATGISMDEFLNELCPTFNARKIRSNQRRKLHFNILLSKNGGFSIEDVERTYTINVSKGGCFIATSQDWTTGHSAAFIIKELAVKTPVVGEIRWNTPWGKKMMIPGIGIRFEDIERQQLQELIAKYYL